MSLVLETDRIGMSYPGGEALAGCTASFGPGVTAVMGHNGSGKSTLLRLCALLEEPTSGRVTYRENGSELRHDLGLRRRITLVLPSTGIFDATVLNNASYGLKVRGVKTNERRQLAMEALRAVGLEAMAGRRALTLSSGEARRLAIARALAIRPEVLFLDEPTASVDEANTEAIEALIKGLAIPVVVFATHDREQASRLADRVLTLSRGRIEQD